MAPLSAEFSAIVAGWLVILGFVLVGWAIASGFAFAMWIAVGWWNYRQYAHTKYDRTGDGAVFDFSSEDDLNRRKH